MCGIGGFPLGLVRVCSALCPLKKPPVHHPPFARLPIMAQGQPRGGAIRGAVGRSPRRMSNWLPSLPRCLARRRGAARAGNAGRGYPKRLIEFMYQDRVRLM